MAITPSGAPAWARTADHTFYGGNIDKRNYLSRGVVDALTDVGAEALARLAADLAAVARTASFAVITFTCNDTSPAAPTINVAYLMTGVTVVSYAGDAPPTGFPSAARNGNGDVTFTFASSYADPYSIAAGFTPRHALTTVHATSAATAPYFISGQTVRVLAVNDAGAAVSNAKVTLEVA